MQKRKIGSLLGRFLLLGVMILATGAGLLGQGTITLTFEDYRPLAVALDALQARCGAAINYEDPPYQNAADLEDVSTPQQRAQSPGYHLMGPRKGTVSITANTAAFTGSAADQLFLLTGLVNSYRGNGMPGDFAIEQANGQGYVIATRVMGRDGKMIDVKSPMKVQISVPSAQRSLYDTVATILDAVSAATGERVEPGAVPNWLGPPLTFGAEQESARDALARLFSQISQRPISYRLLFDPTLKWYMLNMYWAPGPNAQPSAAPSNPAPLPTENPSYSKSPK